MIQAVSNKAVCSYECILIIYQCSSTWGLGVDFHLLVFETSQSLKTLLFVIFFCKMVPWTKMMNDETVANVGAINKLFRVCWHWPDSTQVHTRIQSPCLVYLWPIHCIHSQKKTPQRISTRSLWTAHAIGSHQNHVIVIRFRATGHICLGESTSEYELANKVRSQLDHEEGFVKMSTSYRALYSGNGIKSAKKYA